MSIEEEYEQAPEGSLLLTDLKTGEQSIRPPAPPVSIEEFIENRTEP